MLAWIRSVLCAQQGWPCLLLSAFLSSVTALFLQQSIKSCRSTEWTVLLTSPAYLAALVSNFLFSPALLELLFSNCFPPLSLAQPALNAMQVAASAVLAMESPNWSTACGVALVAAGVFVIV